MKSYNEYIDFANLEQVCAVANTPTYLYNNFQRDQSILILSTKFSDQELISFFFSEYNEKRTFRNLVTMYALIVAMSFKNSVYINDFFSNLFQKKDIKWNEELARIYFSRMKVITFVDYDTITSSPNNITNSITYNSPVEFNIS